MPVQRKTDSRCGALQWHMHGKRRVDKGALGTNRVLQCPTFEMRMIGIWFVAILGCSSKAPVQTHTDATSSPPSSVLSTAKGETDLGCVDGGWCWVEPLPQGSPLTALWAVSSSEAWAVGHNVTILHFSNGKWRRATPPAGARGNLEAIWGTGPNDVWAVGGGVLHWDGKAWSEIPGIDKRWRLRSVSGSSPQDVWIASARGTTWHWDGHRVTERPLPPPASPLFPTSLVAIWSNAPDDAWTVSSHGDVFHWNGKTWTLRANKVMRRVRALWGAGPRDLWMAGTEGLRHWDGASWQTAAKRKFSGFTSVSGTGVDDIWVGSASGLSHWDGKAWSLEKSSEERLLALSSTQGRVWALSAAGNVLRSDGGSMKSSLQVQSVVDRGPMWGFGDSDLWIANLDAGSFSHWDGTRWSRVKGPDIKPWAMWGARSDDIWAVGSHRGAAHWDGQSWKPVEVPVKARIFHSVSGSAADDVWAVGDGGSIIHWNGRSWKQHPSGTPGELRGVWVSSKSAAWAVGAGGVILRWDGTTWHNEKSVLADELETVWGSGPDDVWVVGNKYGRSKTETILHWDGKDWSEASGGVRAYSPRTMFGTGPKDVWIVGLNLLHWDGVRWSEIESPAGQMMRYLWATQNTLWTSSSMGVLRRSR